MTDCSSRRGRTNKQLLPPCVRVASSFLIPSQTIRSSSSICNKLGEDFCQAKKETEKNSVIDDMEATSVSRTDQMSLGSPSSEVKTASKVSSPSSTFADNSGSLPVKSQESTRRRRRRRKGNRNKPYQKQTEQGCSTLKTIVNDGGIQLGKNKKIENVNAVKRDNDAIKEDGGDVIVFQPSDSCGSKNRDNNMRSATEKTNDLRNRSRLNKPKNKKKDKIKTTGYIPDVYWRAVPMKHLRAHPVFEPLPHPNTITHLSTIEDVRYFRQDSWQWNALHSGRCTTSQAAAALGFLEPNAGRALGIPQSLQRGGMGAYFRLRSEALRNLDEMNQVLCTGGNGGNHEEEQDLEVLSVWKSSCNNDPVNGESESDRRSSYPFAAQYLPRITESELMKRKNAARKSFSHHNGASMMVRMDWGNAQEATALLTALNYFWKKNPNITIREVGMCGAGLPFNSSKTGSDTCSSLLIGASPDGVICHPNGTLEALEVKNHCPFVPANWLQPHKKTHSRTGRQKKHRSSSGGAYYGIRELPPQPTVPAAYVPQLMMHMLSLGEECRSAVMVRQTATSGAVILRLHRDDEWISEMLYWLRRFVMEFVERGVPPPTNFFWDEKSGFGGGDRYRKFVRRTREIGETVELVDFVKQNEVQRVLPASGSVASLFLD